MNSADFKFYKLLQFTEAKSSCVKSRTTYKAARTVTSQDLPHLTSSFAFVDRTREKMIKLAILFINRMILKGRIIDVLRSRSNSSLF